MENKCKWEAEENKLRHPICGLENVKHLPHEHNIRLLMNENWDKQFIYN